MKNKITITDDTKEENHLKTSISIWVNHIDECYKDFETRISKDAWRKILEDEVCVKNNHAASEQLLNYLMSCYRLPKPIWELMNECFKWKERKQELYQRYPRKFVDFVLTSIEEEDKVCYDQMRVGLGVSSSDIDKWIRTYYNLEVFYVLDDIEQLKETLDIIKHYDITYPRVDFIEQYYWNRMNSELSNKVSNDLSCKINDELYNTRKIVGQRYF